MLLILKFLIYKEVLLNRRFCVYVLESHGTAFIIYDFLYFHCN